MKKKIRAALITLLGFSVSYLGVDFTSKRVSFPYESAGLFNHYRSFFFNLRNSQDESIKDLFEGKFRSMNYKLSHLSSDTFFLIYDVEKFANDGNVVRLQLTIPRPVSYIEHLAYIFNRDLWIKSSPMKVVKLSEEFEGLEKHIVSLLDHAHREVGPK